MVADVEAGWCPSCSTCVMAANHIPPRGIWLPPDVTPIEHSIGPVVATARPFGDKSDVALASCVLAHRDTELATATVRSFYIHTPDRTNATGHPRRPDGGACRRERRRGQALLQDEDPVLNNLIGIVHGGVSAMALELVASAALNTGGPDQPLRTSSCTSISCARFIAAPNPVMSELLCVWDAVPASARPRPSAPAAEWRSSRD